MMDLAQLQIETDKIRLTPQQYNLDSELWL